MNGIAKAREREVARCLGFTKPSFARAAAIASVDVPLMFRK